jgi:uncharacterized protein DUF4325
MVIRALDHVENCYSWDNGTVIARLLRAAFENGDNVILSFDSVSDIPSSFVNAALISLLEDYSFDFIRAHLRISDASRQIIDMIRRRFDFEIKKAQASRSVSSQVEPAKASAWFAL